MHTRHAWGLVLGLMAGCSNESSVDQRSHQPTADVSEGDSFAIRYGAHDDRGVYHSVVQLIADFGSNRIGVCSGSIVGPDLVLTAAHCVMDENDPTKPLANPALVSTRNSANTKSVKARRFKIHPLYVPVLPDVVIDGKAYGTGTPDLAVIQFSEPLGYAETLRLAATISTPSSQNVTMVGWGVDQNDAFDGRRVGTGRLTRFLPNVEATADGAGYQVRKMDGLLLVSPGAQNQISCGGDSGSPLLDANKNILGVLSFGTFTDKSRMCATTVASSYTSVAAEQEEIAKMIAAFSGATTTSWQNPANRLDVNADGRISTLDALLVLADISARGARTLTTPKTAADNFVDTTGDGRLTAMDILQVIAYISQLTGVNVRSTTTAQGTSLYHVELDDEAPYSGLFGKWKDPAGAGAWTSFAATTATGQKALEFKSTGTGRNGARWTMHLDPGTYQLQVSFPVRAQNAPRATYDLKFSDGRAAQRLYLDQTRTVSAETIDGVSWQQLGARITVTKAVDVSVFLTDLNAKIGSQIVADGIRARQE